MIFWIIAEKITQDVKLENFKQTVLASFKVQQPTAFPEVDYASLLLHVGLSLFKEKQILVKFYTAPFYPLSPLLIFSFHEIMSKKILRNEGKYRRFLLTSFPAPATKGHFVFWCDRFFPWFQKTMIHANCYYIEIECLVICFFFLPWSGTCEDSFLKARKDFLRFKPPSAIQPKDKWQN